MDTLLNNLQADVLYEDIVLIHMSDGGWEDKTNRLRSIFDKMLVWEVQNKFKLEELGEEFNGFGKKIDSIHAQDDIWNTKLHELRKKRFNILQHSTGPDGHQKFVRITRKDYVEIVSTLVEYIAKHSGRAISQEAIRLMLLETKVDGKQCSPVAICIVLELFKDYESLTKGVQFVKEFEKFMLRKDSMGLANVEFNILTYSPSMTIKDFELDNACKEEIVRSYEWSLAESLKDSYSWLMSRNHTNRILIWVCSDIPDNINIDVMQNLWYALDNKEIQLLPIYSDEKALLKFKEVFPKTKNLTKLNYKKSYVFFNSIARMCNQRFKKSNLF